MKDSSELGPVEHYTVDEDGAQNKLRVRPCTDAEAEDHAHQAAPIYSAIQGAEALGPEITSRCRVDDLAHFFDAVDVKSSCGKHGELAAAVSRSLGARYYVQLEELLPNDQQRITKYQGGHAAAPVVGKRDPKVTGTHVHIQTDKKLRKKAQPKETLPPM